MTLSPAGKKKIAAQVLLFVVNITVLALAARVNQLQDFFYAADLFPLGLSIATLVLLLFLLTTDLTLKNAFTSRAHIEIIVFGVLSILWLGFSAFSTSRWSDVPMKCDAIPIEFPDERTWCKNLQALKSFVWIEFVICFLIAVLTLRYAMIQHNHGHKHIWQMSLSRYRPELDHGGNDGNKSSFLFIQNQGRSSEFLQYGSI